MFIDGSLNLFLNIYPMCTNILWCTISSYHPHPFPPPNLHSKPPYFSLSLLRNNLALSLFSFLYLFLPLLPPSSFSYQLSLPARPIIPLPSQPTDRQMSLVQKLGRSLSPRRQQAPPPHCFTWACSPVAQLAWRKILLGTVLWERRGGGRQPAGQTWEKPTTLYGWWDLHQGVFVFLWITMIKGFWFPGNAWHWCRAAWRELWKC